MTIKDIKRRIFRILKRVGFRPSFEKTASGGFNHIYIYADELQVPKTVVYENVSTFVRK